MTNDEKRIAIAEACGWWGNRHGLLMRPPLNNSDYREVPDYLSDLNAMNEAEKALTEEQRPEYESHLYKVCGESWSAVIYATATQRAEAFLAVINRPRTEPHFHEYPPVH